MTLSDLIKVIKQIPPRYAAPPHGPLTTALRWYAAPTMDESEFFFRLTPDRVLEAVESGGFHPTGHCTALNALENRVYDVRVDGEGGDTPHRNLVAKFYRPGRWSRDAILDEHRMLGALRDAEIPVCAPLVFDSGETLREVEGIFYALWPRTGGRSPDEFSDAQIEVLGTTPGAHPCGGRGRGGAASSRAVLSDVPLGGPRSSGARRVFTARLCGALSPSGGARGGDLRRLE